MKSKYAVIIGLLSAIFLMSMSGCPDGQPKEVKVKITTEYGDMVILLSDSTPQHRDNFLKLVNESFYDSLLFHRVMKNFMIQGGDPNSKGAAQGAKLGNGGPGYTIPAEFNSSLIHRKGAVAAARQPDQVNPEKKSSGSQFYIVQGELFPEEKVLQFENRLNQGKDSTEFFRYSEEQIKIYGTEGGTPWLDGGYTIFGQVVEGLNVIDSIGSVHCDRRNRPLEDVLMSIEIIK